MKIIGDKCGGWLETEEEIDLRNHLRWARLKVKGPPVLIPPRVEIEYEGLIFTIPICSETPVFFRRSEEVVSRYGVGVISRVEEKVYDGTKYGGGAIEVDSSHNPVVNRGRVSLGKLNGDKGASKMLAWDRLKLKLRGSINWRILGLGCEKPR